MCINFSTRPLHFLSFLLPLYVPRRKSAKSSLPLTAALSAISGSDKSEQLQLGALNIWNCTYIWNCTFGRCWFAHGTEDIRWKWNSAWLLKLPVILFHQQHDNLCEVIMKHTMWAGPRQTASHMILVTEQPAQPTGQLLGSAGARGRAPTTPNAFFCYFQFIFGNH